MSLFSHNTSNSGGVAVLPYPIVKSRLLKFKAQFENIHLILQLTEVKKYFCDSQQV